MCESLGVDQQISRANLHGWDHDYGTSSGKGSVRAQVGNSATATTVATVASGRAVLRLGPAKRVPVVPARSAWVGDRLRGVVDFGGNERAPSDKLSGIRPGSRILWVVRRARIVYGGLVQGVTLKLQSARHENSSRDA